jgi:hypothetical protein
MCPTPTFSVGAYGGGGNDWSDNYIPTNASSSSGINNYGLAAGLRLPFGASDLIKFCKEYAKAKAEFERVNTENFKRNAQISLLRQCNWLFVNRINLKQDAFSNSAFSTLKECSKISFEPTPGIDNRGTDLSEGKPIESQVTTTTTQTLQVEGTRILR